MCKQTVSTMFTQEEAANVIKRAMRFHRDRHFGLMVQLGQHGISRDVILAHLCVYNFTDDHTGFIAKTWCEHFVETLVDNKVDNKYAAVVSNSHAPPRGLLRRIYLSMSLSELHKDAKWCHTLNSSRLYYPNKYDTFVDRVYTARKHKIIQSMQHYPNEAFNCVISDRTWQRSVPRRSQTIVDWKFDFVLNEDNAIFIVEITEIRHTVDSLIRIKLFHELLDIVEGKPIVWIGVNPRKHHSVDKVIDHCRHLQSQVIPIYGWIPNDYDLMSKLVTAVNI